MRAKAKVVVDEVEGEPLQLYYVTRVKAEIIIIESRW